MSNIALLSSSANAEASQIIPTVNGLIQSINSGVQGLVFNNSTTGATIADTNETTLQTFTFPANYFTAARGIVRIRAWGATGATANNKTMKLYFGASVITTPAAATNAKGWWLDLIVQRTAAATQRVYGSGQVDTTMVTPYYNAGTDDFTTALIAKLTGTNGTAAANDILCYGMIGEVIQ